MPLLDGRALAASLRTELREQVRSQALCPVLAVLLVGNDPASKLYVSLKSRAAEEIGAKVRVHHVNTIATSEAVGLIQAWNTDSGIHGILVQLPLPASLDVDAIIAAIDPAKDVDSFHPTNREALLRGEGTIFSPVHLAVLSLLASAPLSLNGARTLVLAKSPIFREPLVHLLKKAGAFVETHDAKPSNIGSFDVVITALGQPQLLHGDELAPGAVVIDISTNTLPSGKTVGDLAPNTISSTQYASPVPGGVGPLTIAYLLKNLVAFAQTSR